MTKTRLLATAAAFALIAGTASAQELKKNEAQPTPAPAAQQKAPAEKVAPNMHAGDRKAPETTGQATKPETDKGPTVNSSAADKSKASEEGLNKRAGDHPAAGKAEMKSDSKTDMKTGAKDADMKAGAKEGAQTNSSTKSGTSETSTKSTASETQKGSATTGQGAASAAKLSTEQRTKITTIIHQHKTPSVNLNVSLSVGTRIPSHVHLYPLPVEVINIYPEWRGYDYVLVGDTIVVIDPRSHEIVAILEA
jgi:hypothetical protein